MSRVRFAKPDGFEAKKASGGDGRVVPFEFFEVEVRFFGEPHLVFADQVAHAGADFFNRKNEAVFLQIQR
jgi:hypothetical protein